MKVSLLYFTIHHDLAYLPTKRLLGYSHLYVFQTDRDCGGSWLDALWKCTTCGTCGKNDFILLKSLLKDRQRWFRVHAHLVLRFL